MKKKSIFLLISILVLAMVSVAAVVRSRESNKKINRVVAKISSVTIPSDESSIFASNSPDAPILIETASVKEINNIAYEKLTGAKAPTAQMSTFPSLKISNLTTRKISRYAIAIKIEPPNSTPINKVLIINHFPIAGNGGTRTIMSGAWHEMETETVNVNGKFVKRNKAITSASPKAWLPGGAANFKVAIGAVFFEDGEQWRATKDF